jgi:hypothetical protein
MQKSTASPCYFWIHDSSFYGSSMGFDSHLLMCFPEPMTIPVNLGRSVYALLQNLWLNMFMWF